MTRFWVIGEDAVSWDKLDRHQPWPVSAVVIAETGEDMPFITLRTDIEKVTISSHYIPM